MNKKLIPLVPLVLLVASCTASEDATPVTQAPVTIDGAEPAATEPPTTEAPLTTEAPVETAAPTTTEAPASGDTGIIWRSAVDPARVNTLGEAPTWTVSGVVLSLDMVVDVPNGNDSALQGECADEAEWQNQLDNLSDPDAGCLYLQFVFTNGDAESSISIDSVVTAEGKQIDVFAYADAKPNTIDNLFNLVAVGAGPGATVYMRVATDEYRTTEEITFVVPGSEFFLPVSLG